MVWSNNWSPLSDRAQRRLTSFPTCNGGVQNLPLASGFDRWIKSYTSAKLGEREEGRRAAKVVVTVPLEFLLNMAIIKNAGYEASLKQSQRNSVASTSTLERVHHVN
ncbi:Uncharacterized protein Fot_26661 [Forsythia ovata]|uniref:Uncharacterized protein n=1 Tax=Forsythia ovata TaxID=205694 RepID=A0ABD1UE19_9LAMI